METSGHKVMFLTGSICFPPTVVARIRELYPRCGDRGSTVVKVLRYKSEGHWFDPRWYHGISHDINPSDRIMALGSTQPLTEMSTGSISWG
jgi:hypothetical protein